MRHQTEPAHTITKTSFTITTLVFLGAISVFFYFGYPYLIYSAKERASIACRQEKSTPLPVNKKTTELISSKNGIVTFWFDGAWDSQFKNAYPVLHKQGYTAAAAFQTDSICRYDNMTWANLRQLQKMGWEITPSGENFTCFISLADFGTITGQIQNARTKLHRHGLTGENFTTPCGLGLYINDHLEKIVKSTYQSARVLYPHINQLPLYDPYHIYAFTVTEHTSLGDVKTWLEMTKENQDWIILVFNRVDDKKYGVSSITLDKFKRIVNLVKDEGLQVATPSQVLHLSKQLRDLKTSKTV